MPWRSPIARALAIPFDAQATRRSCGQAAIARY
jgi:hypothetical protein